MIGLLFQEVDQDPILDEWQAKENSVMGDFDGMAKAPIITPQGLRAVSGTYSTFMLVFLLLFQMNDPVVILSFFI